MKSHLKSLASFAVAAAVIAAGCTAAQKKKPLTADEKIQRGKYLVAISDCNACHTPWKMGPNGPEPDMALFLSGHPEKMKMPPLKLAEGPWVWAGAGTNTAFAGPWGVSYAVNLTPDEQTGIGIWTEDMFVKAIREGKHFGQSRPIMPPMPWPAYAQMTDEDLTSVFAYLKSLPPIVNKAPDYEPPAGPEAK